MKWSPVQGFTQQFHRTAQNAGAGPLEQAQVVLLRGARLLVDGQGDDLVHRLPLRLTADGAVGEGDEAGVGEGDEPGAPDRSEQRPDESAPALVPGIAVERLGDDEGLLADGPGEHGAAHHGQVALILLDDGVHAPGHAGARGHAPVGAEDDGDAEGRGGPGLRFRGGVGAHSWTSWVVAGSEPSAGERAGDGLFR